uniref:Uncharacterized protein n=1 Tax=Trichogramma kaykai TaxID=54128 RepID=A0ABD2X792_9HYME
MFFFFVCCRRYCCCCCAAGSWPKSERCSTQGSPDHVSWYRVMNQRMEEDDYGEGFIAESHPLRPTHLNVPLRESRAPSISSSVTDMDVPIYTRDTTIPLSGKLVSDLFMKYFFMKVSDGIKI